MSYLSPSQLNNITTFTVEVENPSGALVTFQISDDTGNDLTSTKMIRGVICDALDTWIVAEAADLTTNGDSDVVDWQTYRGTENALAESKVTWDMQNKKCTLSLTAVTSLDVTTDLTVTAPFASVYS
jgi:hypothetical protein